jgi:hypothetical protein
MKSALIQFWRELFGDATSIVSVVMVSAISPQARRCRKKTVGKLSTCSAQKEVTHSNL